MCTETESSSITDTDKSKGRKQRSESETRSEVPSEAKRPKKNSTQKRGVKRDHKRKCKSSQGQSAKENQRPPTEMEIKRKKKR